MARGGGVRLATKGLGVAYGFVGFIGGLVIDYLGRVMNPADRTSNQISTMDMIELGGGAIASLIGYLSPSHGEWVPLSAGMVNGMLYAKIFGPRLFGKRYILTTIDSRGQLTSGAGYSDDTSNFGGGYATEDLSVTNYPTMPVDDMMALEGQQFANTGPIGDPDMSDIYDVGEFEEYV